MLFFIYAVIGMQVRKPIYSGLEPILADSKVEKINYISCYTRFKIDKYIYLSVL